MLMKHRRIVFRPRFSIATLLFIFPVVSLLLWANLQPKIDVSRPFDLGLGEPVVDVSISSGWPVTHRWIVYLVYEDEQEEFLSKIPWTDSFDVFNVAVNAAVGLLIVLTTAMCSEIIICLRCKKRDSRARVESTESIIGE